MIPAESFYVGVEMACRCFENISKIEKIISIFKLNENYFSNKSKRWSWKNNDCN